MSKKLKPIPQFNNEQEEADFWMSHDTTDYLDWSKANSLIFPNLKPSSRLVSLRLPLGVIERAKVEANKRDMPYQSLIKQILYDVFLPGNICIDAENPRFALRDKGNKRYGGSGIDKQKSRC